MPARSNRTPTRRMTAGNAIEYAYRDLGESEVPLVLLQHFRGNLDNWDPALVDALAADRRVVAFDNVGVGATPEQRRTPSRRWPTTRSPSSKRWTSKQVDLLGFSIGSFVAQEIALVRLTCCAASCSPLSAPQGAAGCTAGHQRSSARSVQPETSPQGYVSVFFAPTDTSREAGQQAAGRIFGEGQTDRDEPTTWQTRQAQYDAVCAWGIPNHSLLQRVAAIELPVFVANGDSDPMILPALLVPVAGLLPNARSRSTRTRPTAFSFSTTASSQPTWTPSSQRPTGTAMGTRLENKTALVTGATSNIGRAVAIMFCRQGAQVVVSGRDQTRGAEVSTRSAPRAGGQTSSRPSSTARGAHPRSSQPQATRATRRPHRRARQQRRHLSQHDRRRRPTRQRSTRSTRSTSRHRSS